MSTSNIRINTYKYSCHCRGEAEGDAQPLKTKRPAKSKADVILDTVTKFLVSHCGKETDWFYEKEAGWLATDCLFKNSGAATKSRVVSTTNSNSMRSIKTAH